MSTNKAAPVSKINRNAVTAIATVIANGLTQVNGTGGLLHSVCNTAKQQYKGAAIPKPDQDAILDELAESQGWKGRAVDIRKSEYRSVLSTYSTLPEAMKELIAKVAKCTWHDGIALSRLIRSGAAPKAAAAKHAKRGAAKSKASDPAAMERGKAKAEAAKLLKRVLKFTKLERTFRDALADLCSEHGVKL